MSLGVPSPRIEFDAERSVSGPFTGIFQAMGSALTVNPIIVVMDNQSTVTVQLSVDGSTVFKTFSSGEAMVLDLEANGGAVSKNVQFYVKGTGGTGTFYVSVVYSR
jgi:hypothetical protein